MTTAETLAAQLAVVTAEHDRLLAETDRLSAQQSLVRAQPNLLWPCLRDLGRRLADLAGTGG